MRAFFNRALCIAAVSLALPAGGAGAAFAATPAYDLQLPMPQADLSAAAPDVTPFLYGELATEMMLLSGVNLDPGADSATHVAPAPFAALSHNRAFAGAAVALASDLKFQFASVTFAVGPNAALRGSAGAAAGGFNLPYIAREADSLLAGVTWNFAKWGGLSAVATETSMRNGLLGLGDAPAAARTDSLGLAAHIGLGGGWVTSASYSQGVTKLDLRPGVVASALADLHSHSYGFAVAKHGVFGNDALGLALTRPGFGYDDSALTGMAAPQQYFGQDRLLEGEMPETDIEVGYTTSFLDGALALQTNAAYQMNYRGKTGDNALALLSRAKIKF